MYKIKIDMYSDADWQGETFNFDSIKQAYSFLEQRGAKIVKGEETFLDMAGRECTSRVYRNLKCDFFIRIYREVFYELK